MVEELNGCENASRVSLDDLRKDLSSLQTRFNGNSLIISFKRILFKFLFKNRNQKMFKCYFRK